MLKFFVVHDLRPVAQLLVFGFVFMYYMLRDVAVLWIVDGLDLTHWTLTSENCTLIALKNSDLE